MKCLPVLCGVLAIASALGCADNSALKGDQNGSGGSNNGGAADAGATGGANNGGQTGGSSNASGGKNGGDDGGPPPLPMPEADEPCGEDINFVGGTVRPDVGMVSANASGVDPSMPGKYKVTEVEVKIPVEATMLKAAGYEISIEAGELSGTVYVPSEDGTSVATDKKFPLLVGGAGFQASYPDYKGYWTQFASHGIAVLGLTTRGSNTEVLHDKEALETSLAITWLTTKSGLKDAIDADKLGTVGHSKGGKVAFFTAAIDPRIDIVFGWDPSNAGGPPCGVASIIGAECQGVPVAPNCGAVEAQIPQPEGVLQYMQAETFVFGVPPDRLVNPEAEHNAINFYRGAPSPANLIYFDGGHAAWVESGLAGAIGNAEIIRITKTVQTAKLLEFFYGASDLAKYLPGGEYLDGEDKVTKVETK